MRDVQMFPPYGDPKLRVPEKNGLAAFRADGACIEENLLALLEATKKRFRSPARFEMLAAYCLSETATYAALGKAAGVTAQRVSQLVANGRKSLVGYANRRWKSEVPPELAIPIQKMQEIFAAHAEDIYTFALYGTDRPRLFCLAVAIFYGLPFSRFLQEFVAGQRKNLAKKGAKITLLLKNAEGILHAAYANASVTVQPDIFFQHLKTGEPMHPDILLEKEDGGSVLIVVRHLAEIAAESNLELYNSLHLFCGEHGYTYMILDENCRSLHKLKEYPPCELFERLESVLAEKGSILKSDADDIGADTEALAAFVLQNRLSFTLSPWKICRKE